MAFSLPVFSITCDIYTGPFNARVFRVSSPCNLALGRRTLWAPGDYPVLMGSPNIAAQLLLPPGTDIRDASQGAGFTFPNVDVVEVPAGSGRWYGCLGWDDFGKGFSNEHRVAQLCKLGAYLGGTFVGSDWPIPGP